MGCLTRIAGVLVVGVVFVVARCSGVDTDMGHFEGRPSAEQPTHYGSVTGKQLRNQLQRVDVVPEREEREGYDRDAQFGEWVEHDGCDTRDRVLARDLTKVTYEPGSCGVATGVLHDHYTGETIHFDSEADPNAVQIDHILAPKLLYDMHAMQGNRSRRVAFANDPANLIAVDGSTNMSKQDDGPGQWLPPNEAFRCDYVSEFLAMARKYDVPISADDAAAVTEQAPYCKKARTR